MVGPNGFEPSTSSVSRKRSRPAELRAYVGQLGAGRLRPELKVILSRRTRLLALEVAIVLSTSIAQLKATSRQRAGTTLPR